jgi:putative nucleotidyltransferase with HDIG domain
MNTTISDSYIDRVEHLPPAPTVATKLLDLFNDPERDIDRVVELMRLDPALTAETLNRCNSAFFSGDSPVTDMFDAVFRLGFYETYCLVISLVGARATSIGKNRGPIDVSKQWRHSVTTAVTAANLAARIDASEPDVFSAGLLHDVGKLVFAAADTAPYTDLVQKSGDRGLSLANSEESAMGVTHATVGARLLTRWGFPESICTIVQCHHQTPSDAAPFEHKAAVIQIANYVAYQIITNPTDRKSATECHPEAMALLNLTDEDIPGIISQTQKSLERVQGLLSLVN